VREYSKYQDSGYPDSGCPNTGRQGDTMSTHIETVKKAIEFRKPDYVPMETIDVPLIYNAYNTRDPEEVKFVPGAENADSLWTNCYSWFHEETGTSEDGESLRRDQFGITFKVPNDLNATYTLLENPLAGKTSLSGFEFPDPDETDPHYEKLGTIIKKHYADRFIDGFIDAGILLTTMFLFGEERFLMNVADNLSFVIEVYEGVMDYYKALVLKYKKAGAHMITDIEDIGGTSSLLINPDTWRKHFKPILSRFFHFVHEQNMYTGLLIDGHCGQVLDDLLDMEIDVFNNFDNHTTGLQALRDKLRGRMCVKATVDMQRTLPMGSPEEVRDEARNLVEAFHTPQGGFICEAVRWHRPAYPEKNVLASVEAFNRYRRDAGV
jgi:uroporphyrinogen decarboxylase